MRIVVTGASGQLGSYLLDELAERNHQVVAWSGKRPAERGKIKIDPIELTDSRGVSKALAEADPDVIIHAAAVSSADEARLNRGRAQAVNVEATRLLAEWAASHARRIVYTSTDLVFDGDKGWYREEDSARPALVYGQTKHAAEGFVVGTPRGLVIRLSLLYGPTRSGPPGFFDRAMAAVAAGQTQFFFVDEHRTPLDYATAARVLVRLAETDHCGLLHLGGPERLSRFELMSRAAAALDLDPALIKPNRRADVPMPEPRPADVSLDCARVRHLIDNVTWPTVETALVHRT